jgi:hypothetical protein
MIEDQLWTNDNLLETSPVNRFHNLGRTALHRAVCSGNESMIRLLLDRGADATLQDSDGNTALHLAAQQGFDGVVSTLLALPVERDATNYMGCTALFLAVEAKHEGTVQELLKSSASLNLKDLLGNSPLHLAVEGKLWWPNSTPVVRFPTSMSNCYPKLVMESMRIRFSPKKLGQQRHLIHTTTLFQNTPTVSHSHFTAHGVCTERS